MLPWNYIVMSSGHILKHVFLDLVPVALAWTDVSENVSPPSSGSLKFDGFPHLYYYGKAVI
jgi:hypothetical protein